MPFYRQYSAAIGKVGGPGGIVPPSPKEAGSAAIHAISKVIEKRPEFSASLYVNQLIGLRLVQPPLCQQVVDPAVGRILPHVRHRTPDNHIP